VGAATREKGHAALRDYWNSPRGQERKAKERARTDTMLATTLQMQQQGATLAEIGAAIGITMSGVHQLLKRARRDGRIPEADAAEQASPSETGLFAQPTEKKSSQISSCDDGLAGQQSG
jgi:hypothetical protein